MRGLLLILILTFIFQSFTKADDIRDFEIEGMSIGLSLLKFMSKNEINNLDKYDYSGKYKGIVLKNLNFIKFDDVQLSYKNDDSYLISSLAGRIHFKNKPFAECLSLQKKIKNDLSVLFKEAEINKTLKRKHPADKSGKSFTYGIWFNLLDGSSVAIVCYDWGKKMEKEVTDKLMVTLMLSEFSDFLNNEHYN